MNKDEIKDALRYTKMQLYALKCSKQPKKQNKPNFYSSPSGVPNVRGGWVGSDVWDKVPKTTFFLGTFPKMH